LSDKNVTIFSNSKKTQAYSAATLSEQYFDFMINCRKIDASENLLSKAFGLCIWFVPAKQLLEIIFLRTELWKVHAKVQ